MEESAQVTRYSYKTYRKGVLCVIITCFAFIIASCSDVSLDSTETAPNAGELLSSYNTHPAAILSSKGIVKNWAHSNWQETKKPGEPTELTSPLFGLATAPNGDILVADAGAGIVGLNGATDIILPGVSDMSPIGGGSMWATEGITGSPGEDTGQALYRVSKGGKWLVADLFEFEDINNPDGQAVDSNPFDVQSLGGRAALVADAGANDLLRVNNQGKIDVLAIFPNEMVSTSNVKELLGCPAGPPGICGLPDMIPGQAVPTSIAIGPDGYYYVGELKGFPAPAGASNIWKVSPDASGAMCGTSPDCVKVFDGGFTSIIDLAFDAKGNLHVAELDEQSWFAVEVLGPGAIAGGTINSCDLTSLSCTEVATGIPILTAITFGKDGTLWATKNALIPGLAEVIEVQ